MLECVSFKSSTPTHSHSQGNSTEPEEEEEEEEEDEPATSTTSPNVSREFHRAVEAHSYNEIRSIIQAPPQAHQLQDNDQDSHHRHILSQVLQPDSHSVREALAKAKPKSTLTRLVSTYFLHSETVSDFCLRLNHTISLTRHLYAPLSDFLSVVLDSPLSQPQCDRAYDLFLQFHRQENPFAFSRLHHLRNSFSDLKLDIQTDLRRSRSRIRLFRHSLIGCSVCFIAAAAGTVVVAAIVAVHAAVGFSALTLAPFCGVTLPKRKELSRLKQLEAAENGTLVVNDINTIDSLVDRLQTAVEADKAYVSFALERGRERHPIQEVLKQLRKNQPVLEQLLGDLEQHICFCFYSVNKTNAVDLAAIAATLISKDLDIVAEIALADHVLKPWFLSN